MAHVIPGKPKIGRHPAMRQSVPMGSFIQSSMSQHVVSEEHVEHPSSLNFTKKDIGGSKYFSPRKKDDGGRWNRSISLMEESGNKTSSNSQMQPTRTNLNPDSVQRRCSDVYKYVNNAVVHPSSESQFVRNEDDFPSLSTSADTKTLQTTVMMGQTTQCSSTSYSEKLKLTHQQGKVGNRTLENETPANSCQKNLSYQTPSRHDNKYMLGNRKDHSVISVPSGWKDLSNSQWHSSPITNKKYKFLEAGDEIHFDQRNISPICKNQNENQRQKNYHSKYNAEESYEVRENDDGAKSSFLNRTQGSSSGNGNRNARFQRTVARTKAHASGSRSTEYATADEGKDLLRHSYSASKAKRSIQAKMEGESFSSEVCNDRENAPNGRGVGLVKADVKNNSKAAWKHVATDNSRGKSNIGSQLSNKKNVANSQQEPSTKTSKKRKNRKSKLKRSLAFQTGKIMILTPELYSRFTGSHDAGHHKTTESISFDLSDMEEYPELGEVNNIKCGQHRKATKSEAADCCTNNVCYPTASSFAGLTETTFQEVNDAPQATGPLLKSAEGTILLSDQGAQNITDKAMGKNGTEKCDKTSCVPRKHGGIRDPGKTPVQEEKAPSSLSEQKTKNRHDGSIQISFSDIISSSMVKVKSETSKGKKQSDSRIKVISSKKVKMDKNLHVPPNALDSSRPVVKRGKERERPKPKKHTRLKRIILKERSEKKQRRSLLAKGENSKNDTEPENEEQNSFRADGEVIPEPETDAVDHKDGEVIPEPETDAVDHKDSLFENFMVGELVLGSHEQSADANLDWNLSISFEVKDEMFDQILIMSTESKEESLDQSLSTSVEVKEESVTQNFSISVESFDESLDQNSHISVEAANGSLNHNLSTSAEESFDQSSITPVEAKDESACEISPEKICDILPEEKRMQAIQIAIHTRHFREYCNHLLSAEIDQVTLSLLGDLTRFQDRLHQKDPVKARIKRRLVYGIKEVTKHLKLKKVKCVILAPDSENIKSKGGLNDAVSEIVRISGEYHIPCVFALRRKTLGKACLKPVPVACVGVFNYDGSEANFKKLIELQAESKKAYDAVVTSLKELITEENVEQLIETQENSPQSLQSLRITLMREKLLAKNPDLHLVFTPLGNVQMASKEE